MKYKRWLTIFSLACLIVSYLLGLSCCASTSIEDLVYYEPGSQIPRLTEEGKAEVKEIALKDSRVKELTSGKDYAVGQKYETRDMGPSDTRIGIWHASEDLYVFGAVLEIWFDTAYTIRYDWFMPDYNEDHEYSGEITMPQDLRVQSLIIYVDLRERKVVGIQGML